MWLKYRNPHCDLLFNFQPYRLQSEQVKHKANSPPESRRPNSKASKATSSSATGQSRGHSSRRYPSSLLGTSLSVPVYMYVGLVLFRTTSYMLYTFSFLDEHNECRNVIHSFPQFSCCFVVPFASLQKRSFSVSGFICVARRPRGCRDI